jgi:outer membrane biosynthesis protein TonB
MNRIVRRPFLMALTLSLLLHLGVLAAPGWGWSAADDALTLKSLDATLRPLATTPLAEPQLPRPAAKKKPAPRPAAVPEQLATPAQVPVTPDQPEVAEEQVAKTITEAVAEAADAVPNNAAGTADAVPPAPTFAPPPAGFATAFANFWPRRGLIRFAVTRGEGGFVIGQSEHRWQHDGSSYQIRAETATTGLAALLKPAAVAQESRGIFVATGLQPLEFRNERDGKLKLRLRLDPDQQRINTDNGGGQAMSGQTQDLLSLFYQLGAMLGDPSVADEFVVMVTTGRKLTQHTLRRVETTTLETPFGTRDVLHLKLPAAAGAAHDESTEVWLDVASRLPLKIRHRDRKGEIFDQTATAVELEQPQ